MSTTTDPTKATNQRNRTSLGAGIFLLLFAAGLVVYGASNLTAGGFMAFGIGFFAFLCGLGLVMMGALETQSKPSQASATSPRPVVMIRCTHCNFLNGDTSPRCSNCGAQL